MLSPEMTAPDAVRKYMGAAGVQEYKRLKRIQRQRELRLKPKQLLTSSAGAVTSSVRAAVTSSRRDV